MILQSKHRAPRLVLFCLYPLSCCRSSAAKARDEKTTQRGGTAARRLGRKQCGNCARLPHRKPPLQFPLSLPPPSSHISVLCSLVRNAVVSQCS